MRSQTSPVILLLAFLALPAVAVASDDPRPTTGSLAVVEAGGAIVEMPLRHTRVRVEVSAFVARAEVEQTFANPYDHPVEAVYTFPLGDKAAVDDFELTVGERTIRGEIKRRDEARQIYESARDEGWDAALLEQERPNVFTQSVANLEPGADVKVRLIMVEVLPYDAGLYRLTFPLVVGPRYIPGGAAPVGAIATEAANPTAAVPDAERVTPPVLRPEVRSGHDVEISVVLDAGVPIANLASPSHRIAVERPTPSTARVSLAPDDRIPNKDFMLRWSVSSDRPSVGLLAHREGDDGFFTLLVQPKGTIGPDEAAPKEMVLVLDTSGSMEGIPIEASKRFAREALSSLGPRDTFNLVRFASGAEVFSKEPLPSDRASVDRGRAWIEALSGGGGTEMLTGLKAAFERPADPNRLRMVVFLTDGFIGDENRILAEISRVAGDARIYTVGIGSSVNHYVLDRMAALGRGTYVFVRPDEKADEALERFRGWVSRPYLTDLRVDWGALAVADVVPETLPDLGSGQNLCMVGRYLAPGTGEVVFRGHLGGRYWEQRLTVALPGKEGSHSALASLWARHRIEELLMSVPDGVPPSVEAEVTTLALGYRLMSPFTSFVAVDDSRVVGPGGKPETIRQPLPIPEGTSFGGVFGKEGPRVVRTPAKAGDGASDVEETLPEDHAEREVRSAPRHPTVANPQGATGAVGGVIGGVLGGVLGGPALSPAPKALPASNRAVVPGDPLAALSASAVRADAIEEVLITTAGAGVTYGRARGGFATIIQRQGDPRSEPEAAAPTGAAGLTAGWAATRPAAGLPARLASLHGTDAGDRLLITSLRVLADLAEDGRLGPSEGKPSLAALLGAQVPSGAIAEDPNVQAFVAWALAEGAAALPHDPWVRQAAERAAADLARRATSAGGSTACRLDAEDARWVRLILGWLRPGKPLTPGAPTGDPSAPYVDLCRAASGEAVPARGAGRRTSWDRLLRAIPLGHLTYVR